MFIACRFDTRIKERRFPERTKSTKRIVSSKENDLDAIRNLLLESVLLPVWLVCVFAVAIFVSLSYLMHINVPSVVIEGMRVTSQRADVIVLTPTEWQKDFIIGLSSASMSRKHK